MHVYERDQAPRLPEGVVEFGVIFRAHVSDRETQRHQMLASILYEAHRGDNDPPWSELPRADRIPFYGRTEDLV